MSEIARVEEEANLILTASVIDNRTSGEAVKGVGTILSELKSDGKIEDYDTPENADITNIKFGVSSITLGAGDNEELTATFESGSDAGGYYAQIKGKKYPVSKVNDKIEIGKTEITTSGNSKRKISSVETSNSEVATVQILENEKDKIKITGVSGGTEGIATATITINYTENISTTITVTVKAKYTVNLYASETATTANSITVVQGEKASEVLGYEVPTAPEGKKFDKWVLKTAVGQSEGQQIGDEATSLLNNVIQNLEVYAVFKDKPIAFRNYGNPVNTERYGNEYKLTSVNEKIKVDIRDTPNDATDDVEVADNWKIFYEDEDFLYLIYGDYYPVELQTASGTSNILFATSTADYPYAVYTSSDSESDRREILKYLRNNSGYTWYSNREEYANNGTEYISWSKIKESLKGLSKMNGKTISVQGAPDIVLWVASWNAKGNTELKATRGSRGYSLMKSTFLSNSNNYIQVKTDSNYNTTANEINHTGYYDTLYFPYTSCTKGDGSSGNAFGYWLASPGECGNRFDRMFTVNSSGSICYNIISNGAYYCLRPVVAIGK